MISILSTTSISRNTYPPSVATQYEFIGLSTDDKPDTDDYPDMANGSMFLEMDTSKVCFYDAAGDQWL